MNLFLGYLEVISLVLLGLLIIILVAILRESGPESLHTERLSYKAFVVASVSIYLILFIVGLGFTSVKIGWIYLLDVTLYWIAAYFILLREWFGEYLVKE